MGRCFSIAFAKEYVGKARIYVLIIYGVMLIATAGGAIDYIVRAGKHI
jgi:hypothetical protein